MKEISECINTETLIKTFEGMAERGTLLTGPYVTQQDLLNQIVGTIVIVALGRE